ncbi:MAG: type II secretion system minor pseudopilin GspJ [Pseudomonadota bacterium]
MRSTHPENGFTLLEVLIAVFITSMISLGVWQVMNTLMDSREGIERVSGAFRDVQKTVSLLERDLLQAVKRPVKDAYGERLPALTSRISDAELELTRQGWRNPLGDKRSELQRVAWEYDEMEERLIRRYWPVLDRAQNTRSREQALLENVESLEVQFRDANGQWLSQWPGDSGDSSGFAEAEGTEVLRMPMPRAVEVVIEHERFGTLRRVVALGEPMAMETRGPDGSSQENEGDEGSQNGEDAE